MSSRERGRDGKIDDAEVVDEELAQILSRARSLPRSVEPERDLWPLVERRIAQRRLSSPDRAVAGESPTNPLSRFAMGLRDLAGAPAWAVATSAALLLVGSTVFATLWWTGQIGAPPPSASLASAPGHDEDARRIADTLRGRDGMMGVHESLLGILAQRREELPPQTVAALEENLRIIDHAIAEIYHAMENRADSHTLNLLLAETYRREAELLKQLEWWSPAPEEKS